LALLAAGWACAHSDAFQDPGETNRGPFSPAIPVQLTYNPGPDLTPAFLPGDTIVLYSYRRSGDLAFNQCIGALPVSGGTTVSESCPRSAAALDSIQRYENPVALDDSLIVLVQSARPKGGRADATTLLGTAPWRTADELTARLEFPIPMPNGVLEISASYLSLIGGDNLAYLAVVDLSACPGEQPFCDRPTLLRTGRELARVNLRDTAVPVVLPGTDYATAAAAGRTAGTVLFTLPFDTRVYERQADGSTVTLFDFGPDSIARDPSLTGNTLVAIVGGSATRWTSAEGVPLQVDLGGNIALVNLSTGQVQFIAGAYQRPVLSVDARVLIAEGGGDLYRIDLQ
jgi:hypothetical protein